MKTKFNRLNSFVKNNKGSELVEKILKVAVSLSIGAVVIGTTWGIVNHYIDLESPSIGGNFNEEENSLKPKKSRNTFEERFELGDLDGDGIWTEIDEQIFTDNKLSFVGDFEYTGDEIMDNFFRRLDLNDDGNISEREVECACEIYTLLIGEAEENYRCRLDDLYLGLSTPEKMKYIFEIFPEEDFPRPDWWTDFYPN